MVKITKKSIQAMGRIVKITITEEKIKIEFKRNKSNELNDSDLEKLMKMLEK